MRPKRNQPMLITTLLLVSGLLTGCGSADNTSDAGTSPESLPTQAVVPATAEVVDYLGEAPPMTSATQILSGGWLIRGDGSEPMFDALVVITNGKIVDIGKRGSLDVPNDSVGVDASGKWVLPGPLTALSDALKTRDHDNTLHFTGEEFPAIGKDRSANLVLFNSNPLRAPEALADVHVEVVNGRIVAMESQN